MRPRQKPVGGGWYRHELAVIGQSFKRHDLKLTLRPMYKQNIKISQMIHEREREKRRGKTFKFDRRLGCITPNTFYSRDIAEKKNI